MRIAQALRAKVKSLSAGSCAVIFTLTAVLSPIAKADLSLETESARLVKPGHFELSAAGEYQTSRNGEEQDVPLAIEFGVVDRLAILIEPVPFTRIRAPGGPAVEGLGDTEITAQYLFIHERPLIPAIAGAFEVKIPTAHNLQIGSRIADYRLYLAASKAVGDFDFSFDVGYNFIGEPSGVRTRNPIDLEFSIEWFINPKVDLFAEVNYVGSSRGPDVSSSEGGTTESSAIVPALAGGRGLHSLITAEIAGTEVVGTAGIRYHLSPSVDLFGSFSYDNNDAKLYRTGVTFKF